MRKNITAADAEKVRKLIMKRFKSWIAADYPEPKVIENYDGRPGQFVIMWEEGPFEWAYYGTLGSMKYAERDPEFGFRLPIVPVPDSLSHVFTEPVNTYTVALYLD